MRGTGLAGLLRLALRNIAGNAFRSGAVFMTGALVAGFALAATLVVRGAEESLNHSLQRLGADIVVIPWGTLPRDGDVDNAHLATLRTKLWMPRSYIQKIAAVQGVSAVSPQLFLYTINSHPTDKDAEIYLIAYEPDTDFALQPWLPGDEGEAIRLGEAVAGSLVKDIVGDQILEVYDYPLEIVKHLQPTGGSLDRSLFVTFDTAWDIANRSLAGEGAKLDLAPESISAILVKVETSSDPKRVALRMMEDVPGVVPLESANLFRTERTQMIGLLKSLLGLLSITWALSLVFVSLVFSIAVNERRRQIGVLRALGARREFILQSLLAEGGILALAGGAAGILLAATGIYCFKNVIVEMAGLPFLFPSPQSLALLSLTGLALALFGITLATLFPAWKISREDTAVIMRE